MNKILTKSLAAVLLAASIFSCEKAPEEIRVTGVTLSATSLTMTEGDTQRLSATISPSDAENKAVKWTSSNSSIASVDNGTVTALSPGSATITVKSDDGGKTATCEVKVNAKVIPVESVSLDKASIELTEGDSSTLIATVKPDNATDKSVAWSSSDESIATVDQDGNVAAIKPGLATIIATTTDGGKTATCEVKVNAKAIPVESVSLDKESIELTEGDSSTLIATVKPDNATDKSVAWSSSDENVATVDQDGKVAAVKPGTATITVKTTDGGKTATCEVKVNERIYPVESVSLDKESIEITEGDNATLTATVKPDNATDKSVAWSSSDESIATVDQDGNVTTLKSGYARIIAISSISTIRTGCDIFVYRSEEFAVDLGLPSGILWATWDLGDEDQCISEQYAWGETETKSEYLLSNYKWYDSSTQKFNKYYNYLIYYGHYETDNRTTLEPDDDVAHVKWCGKWRMPTEEEARELLENCTITRTSKKHKPNETTSTRGFLLTSKINGNSIFLRECDQGFWISTAYGKYMAVINISYYYISSGDRQKGRYVRPVLDKR